MDAGHSLDASVAQLQRWSEWLYIPAAVLAVLRLCQQKSIDLQAAGALPVPPEAGCGVDDIVDVLSELAGEPPDDETAVDLMDAHEPECVMNGGLLLLYREWVGNGQGVPFSQYLRLQT